MNNVPDILLIGNKKSTFVLDDIKLLSQIGRLTILDTSCFGNGTIKTLSIIYKSITLTIKNKIIITWFADYYSFVPVVISHLFKKKFITIAGGYDVANIPEINHGGWIKWHRRFAIKYTFFLSSDIWCVSQFAQNELNKRFEKAIKSQVVYLALDKENFKYQNAIIKKPNVILTIGYVNNERSYFVKGFDRWLNLANNNLEHRFIWVGYDAKFARKIIQLPKNCEIINYLTPEKLEVYFQMAGYYCQPSRMETFGKSVLESMIYKCIPIVAKETALPEITEENSYNISSDKWANLKLNILFKLKSINMDNVFSLANEKYSMQKRKEGINTRIAKLNEFN